MLMNAELAMLPPSFGSLISLDWNFHYVTRNFSPKLSLSCVLHVETFFTLFQRHKSRGKIEKLTLTLFTV